MRGGLEQGEWVGTDAVLAPRARCGHEQKWEWYKGVVVQRLNEVAMGGIEGRPGGRRQRSQQTFDEQRSQSREHLIAVLGLDSHRLSSPLRMLL